MTERKIIQIGVVVRDLERAVKQYYEVYGAGPWDIYTYAPPEMLNGTYRGKPSDWSSRIAFAWVGDRQLELIQPLKGPNIYSDFIERHGEGLHHLKEWVEDCDRVIDEYRKKGIFVIQSGEFDGSKFYYLDTEPYLGTTLEIVKSGGVKHREPDQRYPVR
jgi:hypothetical protein